MLSPSRRRDLLLVLAIAGTGIAAYLTYVGFNEQVEPICTGVGDCVTVQRSPYARVAAVPQGQKGDG